MSEGARDNIDAGDPALVAAHPWDTNGAEAAGLTAAYVSADRPFSPVMRKPDVEAATLLAAAEALANL